MTDDLIIEGKHVEGDLVVQMRGITPDRSFFGRLKIAWAVLRGREIGRPVVVTGCWVGMNLHIDREPFSPATVIEFGGEES